MTTYEINPVDPDVYPIKRDPDGNCGCPAWAKFCTRAGCVRGVNAGGADVGKLRADANTLWSATT